MNPHAAYANRSAAFLFVTPGLALAVSWTQGHHRRQECQAKETMSADMIDYMIGCAENRAMTSYGEENAKIARYQYNKILAEVDQLKQRNLDLSGDVGKLSAITVVALDLLRRFVQQSREPDEGDCVYCNCELGGGNEYHCYNDCIITEVRKLLDSVEKGKSVSVDRAVLHDLQENNWSIPEHEDEF